MIKKGRGAWEDFDSHSDAGALDHLARKREREKIVDYLKGRGYDTLADDLQRGEHYQAQGRGPEGSG